MVLQLCGRVCRRLSLENPHHLVDGDFFVCKILKLFGIHIDFVCCHPSFGSGAKVGDYAKRLDKPNMRKSIFLTYLN
jgi:hypothetical protein